MISELDNGGFPQQCDSGKCKSFHELMNQRLIQTRVFLNDSLKELTHKSDLHVNQTRLVTLCVCFCDETQ